MQSMRDTTQTDKGIRGILRSKPYFIAFTSCNYPPPPQAKKLSIIERPKTLATIIIYSPGGGGNGSEETRLHAAINKGTHQTWQCRIKFNFVGFYAVLQLYKKKGNPRREVFHAAISECTLA